MSMIVAALLTGGAHASTTTSVCSTKSASWEKSTEACSCVRDGETAPRWWSGVALAIKDGADPWDRVLDTCFEFGAVKATVAGSPHQGTIAKAIDAKGTRMAEKNSAIWFNLMPPESIILTEETDQIDGELNWMPMGSLFIGVDLVTNQVRARVSPRPNQAVLRSIWVDLNNDQIDDLVIVFDDGDVWNALGPIVPNQVLFPPQ